MIYLFQRINYVLRKVDIWFNMFNLMDTLYYVVLINKVQIIIFSKIINWPVSSFRYEDPARMIRDT